MKNAIHSIKANIMQIVLISGLAGAGKSTALKILEDNGYYCVDNLPPSMITSLIETHPSIEKIAIVVDTRSHKTLQQLPLAIKNINALGADVKIIYLEASSEILIKRFSETRRKHPLSHHTKTIIDCIYEEQEILSTVKQIAHRIDTSNLSANELRRIIKQFVNVENGDFTIVIQSFGFKYGLPIDSDFVFDVRCLPNPHYAESIRDFNGTEAPIIEFLQKEPKVTQMTNDIFEYLHRWVAEINQDNRNYLTISIGCTGGKHRSVYITDQLFKLFHQIKYKVLIRHRQI